MRTNMNRAGERGREGGVERNAMNLDSPPEGVKMEKMGERTKKMKKLKCHQSSEDKLKYYLIL